MTDQTTIEPTRATSQQQISNVIAGLYKQHIGRGPTKVITVIAHDTVLCVVEDTSIPYERTLLELGADNLIDAGRTRLQHFIGEHLIGTIEAATGHRVRAHVPGYSSKADAATEVFLLDGQTMVEAATEITALHADAPPTADDRPRP